MSMLSVAFEDFILSWEAMLAARRRSTFIDGC
jgi:hypothetical protein